MVSFEFGNPPYAWCKGKYYNIGETIEEPAGSKVTIYADIKLITGGGTPQQGRLAVMWGGGVHCRSGWDMYSYDGDVKNNRTCEVTIPNSQVSVSFCVESELYGYDTKCCITLKPAKEYCSQNVRVVTSDGASVSVHIEWGDGADEYGTTPKTFTRRYEEGKSRRVTVSASGYTSASKTFTTCISQFTLTLTKEVVACSDWTTKSTCESHGCFWYNNACHKYRPVVCSDYTDALTCAANNCYWWSDGKCHDTEEEVVTPGEYKEKCGVYPTESATKSKLTTWWACAAKYAFNTRRICKKYEDDYDTFFRAVRDDVKASEGFLPYCPYYGCKHKEWAPNGHGVELYFKSSALGKWSIGTFSYLCSDLPPIEKKDTVICDFNIYDTDDKKVTDLVAGVRYAIKAYLCKVEGGGCAEILKGCDSGCKVSGEELKLFLSGQAAEVAKGTTNVESGYTAFYWTPSADIAGDNSIKLEFKGGAKYNASESATKMVTVSGLRIKCDCTNIDVGDYVFLNEVKKVLGKWVVTVIGGAARKNVTGDKVLYFTAVDGISGFEVGKHYSVVAWKWWEYYIVLKPLLNFIVSDFAVIELKEGLNEVSVRYQVSIVGTTLCGFFDIDPESTECSMFLAEFADPVFVANTLSVITKGEDLEGNKRPATTLDYVFLPIVVVGSFSPVPVGMAVRHIGRKVGLIIKNCRRNITINTWLIKNKKLWNSAMVYGSEDATSVIPVVLERIWAKDLAGTFLTRELDNLKEMLEAVVVTSRKTEVARSGKLKSFRELIERIKDKLRKAKKTEKEIADILDESGITGAHADEIAYVAKKVADEFIEKSNKLVGNWGELKKLWVTTCKSSDEVLDLERNMARMHPDARAMHNLMRYTKGDYIKALKAEKSVVPIFANRFDEGIDFLLRHIGEETGTEVARYRRAMGGLSSGEAKAVVKELKAVGRVNEASVCKGLITSSKRVKSGGAVDGVKEVADDVKGVKGAEAQKAAHKVGKDAAENIPPTAADEAKDVAHKGFFSRIKLPKVVKYLTNWKLWTFYMSFCFFPFIAEETAQRIGFISIPDMATIQTLIRLGDEEQALIEINRAIRELEGDPLTGETGIIKEFNDKLNFWYDVATVPCFWMKPWYDRYFEIHNYDLKEKVRNYKVLRDAFKEHLSLTPEDVGSIKVITNLAGARIHVDGGPTFVLTTKVNGKAEAIIHNIKTESGTIGTQHSVMIFDPSGTKLMDMGMVTVYKNQPAKIEFTLNPFPEVPKDAFGSLFTYGDSLNGVGGQSGLENQPNPYGNVNPDIWWYGTCKFHCTSTPSGAWVWIDGENKKKQTPCYIDDITAHIKHRVEFRHPNYPTKVFENQWAKTGKTIDIDYVFEEPCSEPSAHIQPSTYTPKVDETVVFDPSGSDPGASASYKTNGLEWDFGDGTKETKTTEEKVSHSYLAKGIYHVNLKVTNDCGEDRDASPVVITVGVPVGNIKCYCEPAEYCGRNADILVDGKKVDVTKASGYAYIKDLTPGVHTVKYNLLDIMECVDDVVVTAGEDAIYEGVLALSEKIKSACSYDTTNFYYKTVKVTKIEDGDSIFTDFTNPFPKPPLFPEGQQVRIAGYDSPDGATARANAKAKLAELIPVGSTVTLKIWPPAPLGKLNRGLAGVFKGDVDIAIEMLKSCLVNESPYKGKDNFPWVDWVDYGRLWKDPVGKECLINPNLKPLVTDIDTTRKAFKINNRWFTLDFTVRFEDKYGVQKGVETKKQVDGRKVSTPIAYAMGTYAIKLFACIEKCDKKENWILVDTGYVVVPTKKTVTFKSVPSGASVTVVKKETARLVKALKRVIRI